MLLIKYERNHGTNNSTCSTVLTSGFDGGQVYILLHLSLLHFSNFYCTL